MSSNEGLYTGAAISKAYYKFRPSYPKAVVERIITFLGHKNPGPYTLAVDVGCGTGKSTVILRNHFDKVIGCDVSATQLQEAINSNHSPNVEYKKGSDGNIPVADNTVDLVTSAQAFHWFNHERFYKEVDRVLKPKGCLAIYGYGLEQFHKNSTGKQLQSVFDEFFYTTLDGFWGDEMRHVVQLYRNINIPYPDSERDDSFTIEIDCSVADCVANFNSWATYHRYLKANPHTHILVKLKEKLMRAIGADTSPELTTINVSFPVYVLLGRKP